MKGVNVTTESVNKINRLRSDHKIPLTVLAERFDLSLSTINRIVCKRGRYTEK